MNAVLCLTVRFLDPVPRFHGRGADGDPEWPPSPLRLFQALVSASASRWPGNNFLEIPMPALRWLETIQPSVVAPMVIGDHCGYRTYVPNNSGDLMTAAWARGDTETTMAEFRVEKDVRPANVSGDAVRFLFRLRDGACPHFDVLRAAARSITHLGWGIDMVAGEADILSESEIADLKGQFWQPVQDSSATGLRVPTAGSLDALIAKHGAFLRRIGPAGFNPVPPLSVFRVVGYRRATEPSHQPCAAFTLLKPDASGMRSFDTLRRTRDVAGMMRHATAATARNTGWSEEQINTFVHGKTPDGSKPSSNAAIPDRFQYLPLPTINHALGRVEAVRRVLVAAPPHCGKEIAWARRALAGVELVNQGEAIALLTILPGSDWVLKQYVGESSVWSTVTPVILPGYDDPDHLRRKLKQGCDAETQKRYLARLDARIDGLLRKAFRQAGYPDELVRQLELEWRDVGFRAGVELASRYLPPENLDNAPRVHVQVRFPAAVRGPIAVGSGRFRGFGLFARSDGG
jgi:CRISPR-associated protein Csb2